MRIIGGSINCKFKIRPLDDENICIIRAAAPDESISIPERLLGAVVTSIAPHAFSHATWEPEDEDIIITTSIPRTEASRERLVLDSRHWDNRRLRELLIPGSVREVGDFAFHNLRSLRTLGLSDSVTSWGEGAVSGCRSLETIYVECRGDDIELSPIPYILKDTPGELTVYLQRGEETVRLIFPEYQEVYTETPHSQAQYLQFYLTGAGYPYHHNFNKGRLSLREYDALWDKFLTMGYELDSALRIALSRLLFPARLEERAAARYRDFISAHIDEALITLMRSADFQGLSLLLGIAQPSLSALKEACRMAGDADNVSVRARLLYEIHLLSSKGGNAQGT